MLYAESAYCFAPHNGQPAPSSDLVSDANVNVASHQIRETTTDPLVSTGPYGWYDNPNDEEIDLCASMFATADWDSGLANQVWNGHFNDLQLEYDNHTSSCVKIGP